MAVDSEALYDEFKNMRERAVQCKEHPFMLTLAEAKQEWPSFYEILQGFPRVVKEKGHVGKVNAALFPLTRYEEWPEHQKRSDILPYTLMVCLPPQFEPFLEAVAKSTPEIVNCLTPDLLSSTTNLFWHRCDSLKELAFFIREQYMMDVIFFPEWIGESEGWVPVIYATDKRIACGGFSIDKQYLGDFWDAVVASDNYKPHAVFSKEALARTAEWLAPTLNSSTTSGTGARKFLGEATVLYFAPIQLGEECWAVAEE